MARAKIVSNWLDRSVGFFSPARALKRIEARTKLAIVLRHYEAAQPGRRTSGWRQGRTDVNAANAPALVALREHTRDLIRNNAWARSGLRAIVRNTVGWGIQPKAIEVSPENAKALDGAWRRWACTTECDADGRRTFYGLQKMIVRMAAESGEALVRRRWRRTSDGLTVPMQLQLLEPDFLDTTKDGIQGESGGKVVQGVEFDALGRRSAYYLFDDHPGSRYLRSAASRRVPASEIIHVFEDERAGQVRAVPWFASTISTLKDFDEYEDATILRQKVAAFFAAFVTSEAGDSEVLGDESADDADVEELEPGIVKRLRPGEEVSFPQPPVVASDGFTQRSLRRVSAGIGVTYEDLTGDYSQVNFSSARMARHAHWGNVYDWQWNMLIPQFCDPAWAWMMEAASAAGLIDGAAPLAEWTPPPIPMVDPDKEGLALKRLVRSGAMTPDEMVRQQGKDPETHWAEYEKNVKMLRKKGIWLDSDASRVSDAGLTQERAGAGAGGVKGGAPASEGEGEGENGAGE